MDHRTHIGFVDTHTESVRRHHDPLLVLLPFFLPLIARGMFQTGMIERRTDVLAGEELSDLATTPPAAHIDDGGPIDMLEDMHEL